MPGFVELLHHGRLGLGKAGGFVVKDGGGWFAALGQGDDDEAGDGLVALLLCGEGEEGGNRVAAASLEESADLRAVAEVAMNIAQHGSHRALQRRLAGERSIEDLTTAGIVYGLQAVVGASPCEERDDTQSGDGHACEQCSANTGHATLL